MKLSNFDWTDKSSVKWFLMLPTGHEGPYSLIELSDKFAAGSLSGEVSVWSEGLNNPCTLKTALDSSSEEEVLPPLPKTDIEEDTPPPLPMSHEGIESIEEVQTVEQTSRIPKWSFALLSLPLFIFAGYQFIKSKEVFSIHRLSKMSPDLHRRIESELKFESWNKPIFFKEYMSTDLSQIWLATSGFQACDIEAAFNSVEGKLLSTSDEQVIFKTRGTLKNHLVEFSNFDFSSGTRVLPGLYDLNVRASSCEWDGLIANAANLFKAPAKNYEAQIKVVLYPKGPTEFNQVLSDLLRKKMELELKNQNQEELFWEGIQEKFHTLSAITLQIEQLFLDFLEHNPNEFKKMLKPTVDKYTGQFGGFLTNFVVKNEEYFKELEDMGLKDISKKRTYEMVVKITAKNLGFASMKLIEEAQAFKKNPSPKELEAFRKKVKSVYKALKEDTEKKVIQVTADRSI